MNTYMLLHIYEVASLQPGTLVTTRRTYSYYYFRSCTTSTPDSARSTLSAHLFRRRKRRGDSAGILPCVRSGAEIYVQVKAVKTVGLCLRGAPERVNLLCGGAIGYCFYYLFVRFETLKLVFLHGANNMPLFAFGSNSCGQLALGHVEDVSIPTRCLFDEDPDPTTQNAIIRIAAGGNHTLVFFGNGAVYAAGSNVDGRFGRQQQQGKGDEPLLRFRRIVLTTEDGKVYDTFKDVSATWEGSFLVARSEDDDVILVLGTGTKGELGLGSTKTQSLTPTTIPNFPPPRTQVVSIASAMGHTVAVLSNGEVYGWGGARKGQLGENAKAGKIGWSPVKIADVSFCATAVTCGREFTVVSGDKEKGEYVVLGSSDDKWAILSGRPGSISNDGACVLPAYTGISAGWHAVYVHHQRQEGGNASITTWGRNDRGQLPPVNLPRAKMLAVGSEHALALLDDGMVVAFGWGEHGNCGTEVDAQGNVKGRYNRIEMSEIGHEREVVGIGAGCATSWVITS